MKAGNRTCVLQSTGCFPDTWQGRVAVVKICSFLNAALKAG